MGERDREPDLLCPFQVFMFLLNTAVARSFQHLPEAGVCAGRIFLWENLVFFDLLGSLLPDRMRISYHSTFENSHSFG